MKLRLAIAVGPGNSIAFEHAGPVIRIGRDPECELALEGEASTAVSRRHASIELSQEGATLTDTGSSNGTLLNGRLIEGATPLHVGDRIQMGYTGATLTVLELDLGSPALANRVRGLPLPVIGGLSAAVVVAVVVAAVIFFRKPEDREKLVVVPPPDTGITPTGPGRTTKPETAPLPRTARTDPNPTTRQDRITNPPPTPERDPLPPPPPAEVASYEVPDHEPSVLLQRRGDAFPWVVLTPNARVATDTILVSLPGYRSFLNLDSGLLLTLWGNLTDFAYSAAVPESVVMLHAPAPDVDLDFTLDRGRIAIANRKPDGKPAHVRLRFLQEEWDLVLSDAKGEVGVEIWTELGELSSDLVPRGGATCVGLFTKKGPVQVHTRHGNRNLGDWECLDWASDHPATLNHQPLRDFEKDVPNCWWTKRLDPNDPGVKKGRRSLLDWCDRLGGVNVNAAKRDLPANPRGPVLEMIRTTVLEGKDPDNQDLGVLFLAALEDAGSLLAPLHDLRHVSVRGVALLALQTWLSRGPHHATDLVEKLETSDNRYSKETAQRIVRLMYPLSEKAVRQPTTYEDLVNCLDHDILPVRVLGLWQLDQLGKARMLPEETKKIDYDPTWDRDQRRPAIEQWKKLIAQGKIPVAGRRP